MKRNSLFSAMLAALVPMPVVAFDSGVNGMAQAEEYEKMSVGAWAYQEFLDMTTGFRQMLDPIYPEPKGFSIIDAQIKQIIADIEADKEYMAEQLEAIDRKIEAREQQEADPVSFEQRGDAVNESSSIDSDLTTFNTSSMADVVPEADVLTDDGMLLSLDTSDGVDLPDLTIDPRDGGTYTSEIPEVQEALDILQSIQDQVPTPIQTTGNDLYNQITGTGNADNGSA